MGLMQLQNRPTGGGFNTGKMVPTYRLLEEGLDKRDPFEDFRIFSVYAWLFFFVLFCNLS